MIATYDPALPADLDWVRFLTGDTDTGNPLVSDQEILAALAAETASGEAKRYYTAATVLGQIANRLSAMTHGVASQTVGRLSISWGGSGVGQTSVAGRISELRKEGSQLLSPKPWQFRML